MKKFFTLVFLALLTSSAFAQTNPNRMLVLQKDGSMNGYLVERIDSVLFKKVEGRVAADVEVHGFKPDGKNGPEIGISVTQTENCAGFRIGIASKLISSTLVDDAAVAAYLSKMGTPVYTENFVKATLTGMNTHFVPGVEYTVMSIAFDKYGIACSGSKADFKVPEVDIVGNPSVRWEVTDTQLKEITVDMKPNPDCHGYYIYLAEVGMAEEQLYTYGPIMGLACMEDFIKTFGGQKYQGELSYTWTFLKPATEYELFILPVDVNENYAKLVREKVSTLKLGGDGVAEISIDFGKFGYSEKNGYYQEVTFTPNDQCAEHRDLVVPKRLFDDGTWTEESYIEYMKNDYNIDNPNDPYWDNYGVDAYSFKAKPNATYYAFSIGKNAKGEYGSVTKVEYTTPASAESAAPAMKMADEGKIIERLSKKGSVNCGTVMKKMDLKIVK